jgi:hypothetical protein
MVSAQTAADNRDAEELMASGKESPQLGGTGLRNNAPFGKNIPDDWNVGKFDRKSGAWDSSKAKNIKWVAALGNTTYGTPVIAGGQVYVGTNNGAGYLKRYPNTVDLGCLLCFSAVDGKFLWQHSSEKLQIVKPGSDPEVDRGHDWPLQGICCSPLVEGDRVWFVTSRGEVCCVDAAGFYDGEDDGPVKDGAQIAQDKLEADVVWVYDMMKESNISQLYMCSCSVTSLGDCLFVTTGNGVDESLEEIPRPEAPSFLCLDKRTGKVNWTDNSPGLNILHGQWSSPATGVLGSVPQVIFAGGDGWVYSFRADGGKEGKPELLWKFDANPKQTAYQPGGAGDRNEIVGNPAIYKGRVYIGVGQNPEHGEGEGHLWCIDPTKRGDVSPELAMKVENGKQVPLPHRRKQAVDVSQGEVAVPNPNSAVVWHYPGFDKNGNGKLEFEEQMHRTIGTPAIRDDRLYIADFSGLFHCVDAVGDGKGGTKVHWTYDMLAQSWGSPLIVEDKVYIIDEDGDVAIFSHQEDSNEPLAEPNMGTTVYSTPVVADNTIFITTRDRLFAIGKP